MISASPIPDTPSESFEERARRTLRNRPLTILIIVVIIVAVALSLVAYVSYVYTPPLMATVSGFVNIQGAHQVNFISRSSFLTYSAFIGSDGRYSITLPNQRDYSVYVRWTDSSGRDWSSSCGTLSLYQTTKLGSYDYGIDARQCS